MLVVVVARKMVAVVVLEIAALSGSPKHPRKRSSITAGEIPASAFEWIP